MAKSLDQVVLALVEDKDLVFRFFAVFSRFEYALKRSQFLKTQERAEADWDAYSRVLRDRFSTVTATPFRNACAYLVGAPPKKQVVDNHLLGWKETHKAEGESTECYVLRLVRTVRNNLFHGGKYPYPFGPVPDAARNGHLLESCLAVLEGCLGLSPEVGHAFEEAA